MGLFVGASHLSRKICYNGGQKGKDDPSPLKHGVQNMAEPSTGDEVNLEDPKVKAAIAAELEKQKAGLDENKNKILGEKRRNFRQSLKNTRMLT